MTKRWPNTSLWQRFEKVFRTTHGSRWRTAAAAKFRVKRGDLRRLIDREDFQDVEKFDKALIEHLHQHVAELRQRAAAVDNVARDVMRARNEVGKHWLIEDPIEIGPVNPGDLRPAEPATPWERVMWDAFADILEDA